MSQPSGSGGSGGSALVTELRPGELPPHAGPEGRFAPGTMVAGRYRVVALLGQGGMGEVYRADDTRLGQRVALKFPAPELASDTAALARLHAEIRIGRQVSHPNICRLYDVGEAEGTQFITMEYVDGEDLASLLRRIGRLPADKALALARSICAGLAAALDAGVLHHDVKPANVMIDGHGQHASPTSGSRSRPPTPPAAASGRGPPPTWPPSSSRARTPGAARRRETAAVEPRRADGPGGRARDPALPRRVCGGAAGLAARRHRSSSLRTRWRSCCCCSRAGPSPSTPPWPASRCSAPSSPTKRLPPCSDRRPARAAAASPPARADPGDG